jgi:hypothetical protein
MIVIQKNISDNYRGILFDKKKTSVSEDFNYLCTKLQKADINSHIDPRASGLNGQIVICILRMRNRTIVPTAVR